MYNLNVISKRQDGFAGERTERLSNEIINQYIYKNGFRELFITSIGYFPIARFHFYERPKNGADYFILIYCIKGHGFYKTEDAFFEISQNQLFIIPPNKAHCYGSSLDDPWTIYWCHYTGSMAQSYSARLFHPISINPQYDSRIQSRIEMFEEILNILQKGHNEEHLAYSNCCFHYLLGSVAHINIFRLSNQKKEIKPSVVQLAIHFMNEHLEKKITLKELAFYCGYSSGRFISLFSKETGESPIHYFNKLKIKLACYYIDRTNIKDNQVCYKIGIENPLYFSRLFKQHMGISTSQYRNKKKVFSDFYYSHLSVLKDESGKPCAEQTVPLT